MYLFNAARQAVKNTPKRVPSVTVRSPLGASPASLEGTQGDAPAPPMDTATPSTEDTSANSVVGASARMDFNNLGL